MYYKYRNGLVSPGLSVFDTSHDICELLLSHFQPGLRRYLGAISPRTQPASIAINYLKLVGVELYLSAISSSSG